MGRTKKIYNYSLSELHAIILESTLKEVSATVKRHIERQRRRLEKELRQALLKYVRNAEDMHEGSKDLRTKRQYIKALVNGWLAEVVVREAILKKIYGTKRVKNIAHRYKVVSHNFTDRADCLLETTDGHQHLVEIKASMSLHGMPNPEEGGRRVFGFKMNSASILLKEAERREAKMMVIWYIIKDGTYHIQFDEQFKAMVNTTPVEREEWGKKCYLFEIPPKKQWRKVDTLWKK